MGDEKNEETGKPQETELREEQLEEASGGLGSISADSSQRKTSETLVEGSIQSNELQEASGHNEPDSVERLVSITCVPTVCEA